jgi:hypothetical protein
MQAANVYYDLDNSKIIMSDTLDLNVDVNKATNINTGTNNLAITLGGGSGDVVINSDTWDVSTTGTISNAILSLRAGEAGAGTAPVKFGTGSALNTVAEAGALEYNGTNLFVTNSTAERFKIADIDQDAMTDGMLCRYTTAGHLDCTVDSASVGHAQITLGNVDVYGSNNATGLAINGSVLNLRSADVSNPGAVNIAAQTFNGLKTFDDGVTSTGTLTASNGLTMTTGALNLTATSGALSLTGLGASTIGTTSQNLTLSTTTSGTLAVTSAGALNLTGNPINLDSSTGVIALAAGDVIQTATGGAATRAAGEEVLVGTVPIFGFDLPAQTAGTVFKDISRVMEDNPFPAQASGTTRSYKFIIRYADTLTITEGPSLWNFYDVGTPGSSIAFTVPYSPGTSLDEGTVAIVDATAGMKTLIEADGDWNLQVRPDDTATGKTIRVYNIDLAAYDVVD